VKFKEGVVREALRRVAGLEAEDWLPPLLGPQWHYRRKARLGIRYVEGKGRVLVGFKERASRLVTDMLHCPVLIEPFDTLPGALSEVLGHTTLRAHVPQAEIAVGDSSSAIVLRVLRTPAPDDIAALSALGTALDCDMYLQPGGPGTVEPIDRTSARPLSYRLPAFDVDLQFAPTDFIQVNGKVNAALVSRVVDGLQIEHGDRVLDLYCGIGNFSIALAQRAGTVTGIEGDAGLVARAARNAQHNGIDAARFMTADLTQADWPFLRTPWDLVVLDPPRSGAEDVVGALWRLRPRRIAYVSCHPATLARDARVLAGGGAYRLKAVGIADMFPNTHHVETVALFEAA
jgi:23S rRNA (uracil1939-C5)-methyltransferase